MELAELPSRTQKLTSLLSPSPFARRKPSGAREEPTQIAQRNANKNSSQLEEEQQQEDECRERPDEPLHLNPFGQAKRNDRNHRRAAGRGDGGGGGGTALKRTTKNVAHL